MYAAVAAAIGWWVVFGEDAGAYIACYAALSAAASVIRNMPS